MRGRSGETGVCAESDREGVKLRMDKRNHFTKSTLYFGRIIMIIFQTMSSNHNIIRNNELMQHNTIQLGTANDFVAASPLFSYCTH